MRRSDRLFQIVQLLRRGQLTTAAFLADELEVSTRTVYRDIADLIASDIPILGEAGVGYILGKGFEMPPLAFNVEEIEALVTGGRMVRAWADRDMAQAASSALSKIEASLPKGKKRGLQNPSFYAPRLQNKTNLTSQLQPLRRACSSQHKLGFEYVREDGKVTQRTVRPLSLLFMDQVWILAAWCETREDFRSFRVDRIRKLKVSRQVFKSEPGKTLKDMVLREQKKMMGKSLSPPHHRLKQNPF